MVQDDRGEQPRPHGSGLGVRENSEAMNLSEDILFYAFRYALGRMTYAVSTVADEIILHAHEIDRKTRLTMIKEITAAIEKGQAGMDTDVETWKSVVAELQEQQAKP